MTPVKQDNSLGHKFPLSFIFGLILLCSLLYFFSYNSGYGYDSLEYLIIGRSLLEGFPFYTFIPSKSWALYCAVAFAVFLGNPNHFWISGIITFFYFLLLITTFLVVERTHNKRTAYLSLLLIGICAFFSELNFLEPEGIIGGFGLLSYYSLTRILESHRRMQWAFVAGIVMGCGMAFKSSAGFFYVGAVVWLFVLKYFKQIVSFSDVIKIGIVIFVGFSIFQLIAALYFMAHGKLDSYFLWSYFFPLIKYPPNSYWMGKLLKKFFWFGTLLIAAFAISRNKRIEGAVYSDPKNWLAISMGLCSSLVMIKTQASHCFFLPAAFFSIYIASVCDQAANKIAISRINVAILSVSIVSLLSLSILLYRPSVLKRFISLRDYSEEIKIASIIQEIVPKDKRVIFFKNSTLLYWLSHRYPNVPFVHCDVQTTYWLKNNSGDLINALRDPNLYLVEFNSTFPGVEDVECLQDPPELLPAIRKILNEDFVLWSTNSSEYVFWLRRGVMLAKKTS